MLLREWQFSRFESGVSAVAVFAARVDICSSMKELGVPDRRWLQLYILRLTDATYTPPVGGEGGGENMAGHIVKRIRF